MLQYLLFDCDNTLYPESLGLENEISRRMTDFVADLLHVAHDEAAKLRSSKVPPYGTTLEWLVTEHDFRDAERYYDFVHYEGLYEALRPDPELARVLARIDLPKSILTNAPREHAERVLARLGVANAFESIFDIRSCGLKGKPHIGAFNLALDAVGRKPGEVLFFDDIERSVVAFIELGGWGVLVDETGTKHTTRQVPRVRTIHEVEAYVNADRELVWNRN